MKSEHLFLVEIIPGGTKPDGRALDGIGLTMPSRTIN